MEKLVVISIISKYAKQIFDGSKLFEFRKTPLKKELLNEKIYVYSAKEDKAIIGYFRISEVLCGNTEKILKLTGYDKRNDANEIISYFGKNNPKCYALRIYDVNRFTKPVTLEEMRKLNPKVTMPQYIKYVYEENPIYKIIKKSKDY